MPDYISMVNAYNGRKRNSGNWVIILCLILIVLCFGVIVYLGKMLVTYNTQNKSSNTAIDTLNLKKYTTNTLILREDSFRNVIYKLRDSLNGIEIYNNKILLLTGNIPSIERPEEHASITLFPSRWNDIIDLPFSVGRDMFQGDYRLTAHFTNISGFSFNCDEIEQISNPDVKVILPDNAHDIDENTSFDIFFKLSADEAKKIAYSDKEVSIKIKCTVHGTTTHRYLNLHLNLQ